MARVVNWIVHGKGHRLVATHVDLVDDELSAIDRDIRVATVCHCEPKRADFVRWISRTLALHGAAALMFVIHLLQDWLHFRELYRLPSWLLRLVASLLLQRNNRCDDKKDAANDACNNRRPCDNPCRFNFAHSLSLH